MRNESNFNTNDGEYDSGKASKKELSREDYKVLLSH
jgi:hypothetical protein